MFNLKEEISFLEKTLIEMQKFDLESLDFNQEAALIRHFETIGRIAKQLKRSKVQAIVTDKVWNNAIRTRDKISHSYFSLDISMLVKAFNDIDYLLSTIEDIKKELNI